MMNSHFFSHARTMLESNVIRSQQPGALHRDGCMDRRIGACRNRFIFSDGEHDPGLIHLTFDLAVPLHCPAGTCYANAIAGSGGTKARVAVARVCVLAWQARYAAPVPGNTGEQ